MCPQGGVHVRGARAAAVAKAFGVDYADAVVGFDFRRGQSFPRLDGIVVASEFSEMIQQHIQQEQTDAELDAAQRRHSAALSRWKRLFKAVEISIRIHSQS
jgi:xeroderma pigmentosum group C-complementing protein